MPILPLLCQEPCQSFRLPVICAFCSATRDVDLLRDADLLQGDEGWRCMHCKHSIDKEEVETRLVYIFQKHWHVRFLPGLCAYLLTLSLP